MQTVAGLIFVLCLLVVGWLAHHAGYRPRNPLSDRVHTKEMARFTGPMILTSVLGHIQYGGYYAVLAYFVSPTAAGAFAIGSLLGVFVRLPLDGFNQIIPQAAATLHDSGSHETLVRLHRVSSRLMLVLALPIATYIVSYRFTILPLFDPVYLQFSIIVPIIAATQAFAVSVGSVGILLSLTDHQDAHLAYNVFVTSFMIITSIGLGHLYGVVGVTLSMLLTVSINNLGQLILINRFEGFQPFTREHLVPLVAAVVMGGFLHVVAFVLSGASLLVAGALVGLVTYGSAIHLLGLPETDRRVVHNLVGY